MIARLKITYLRQNIPYGYTLMYQFIIGVIAPLSDFSFLECHSCEGVIDLKGGELRDQTFKVQQF